MGPRVESSTGIKIKSTEKEQYVLIKMQQIADEKYNGDIDGNFDTIRTLLSSDEKDIIDSYVIRVSKSLLEKTYVNTKCILEEQHNVEERVSVLAEQAKQFGEDYQHYKHVSNIDLGNKFILLITKFICILSVLATCLVLWPTTPSLESDKKANQIIEFINTVKTLVGL
jgi:hypothetical protein